MRSRTIMAAAALVAAGALFGRMTSLARAQQAAPRSAILFTNAKVFDGRSERLTATTSVLVVGNKIEKIGGLADGSKLSSGETEEVAHMLFGDGVGYSALFATHPPLQLRIKAIDPAFDPAELDADLRSRADRDRQVIPSARGRSRPRASTRGVAAIVRGA